MDAPPAPFGTNGPSIADFLEFVPDATVGVDASGAIVLCNAQAAQVFGYRREELLGQSVEALVGLATTTRHAALRSEYQAQPRLRRMGTGAPLTARRSDGTEFPVEVSLSSFEGIHDGENVVLAAVRDVSGRVAADEVARQLRDELGQARKLESLGQLAGGVAHDFNNLLAVILNFCDLAAGAVVADTQLAQDIAEIRRAAERGRALTRKLLIVGRRDVGRPARVDLAAMLTSLRPLLLSAVGEGIDVRYQLDATRAVLADLAQMEQVVLNLAVNARDAMPRGGTLLIRTSDADLDVAHGPAGDELPRGRYVQLAVTDSGTGMTTDIMASALDPFFTTKPAGQGSGLGLSTVYGIVRETGGSLELESELGAGTTVSMLLPAFTGPGAAHDAEPAGGGTPAEELPAPAGERILVVEDEPELREACRRTLEGAGYRVQTADGAQAAQRAALDAPFDLYVFDVVMPGMSGVDLRAWLLDQQPHARVLFVSGYDHGHLEVVAIDGTRTSLLSKPFAADELVRDVARLLHA